MRDRITRELIAKKGFRFVAIEGDWPDAARVDHYVRHLRISALRMDRLCALSDLDVAQRRGAEPSSTGCARTTPRSRPAERAAFHGLDLYSLYNSIRAVLKYLDEVDPATARVARERYGCLTPWQSDPATYGHAALTGGYPTCEAEVAVVLTDLLHKRRAYAERDGERFLDAVQNARLIANAEHYYRIMYYGSRASWNLRDSHMFETLKTLLAYLRAGQQGDRLGAQLPHRRRRGDRDVLARRAQPRPPLPQGIRRSSLSDRLRHRWRHRRGGVRLGRADGDQDGIARARGQLRALLPRLGHRLVLSRPAPIRAHGAAGPAQAAARARHRRDLPARDRARQSLLPGRSCRSSSTSTSGSTKPAPSRRSRPGRSRKCRTPIRSGFEQVAEASVRALLPIPPNGPDYCSNRSTNHLSSRIQISSLPTWSSMPCSRFGLSLTSMTMKPWSVSLMSTP